MPNGDDDISSIVGSGSDEGGGMFSEPAPMPSPTDDDDGNSNRKVKRRTQRARFRSTRQARRTTSKRR